MEQVNPVYDVQYFIDKFEGIPEELWNEDGNYINSKNRKCKCAMGHLGIWHSSKLNDEAIALSSLIGSFGLVTDINDGYPSYRKYGSTPKERILNALKEIKQSLPT